jgi:RNA polymerase sigma-70 factor, ECF subfamily
VDTESARTNSGDAGHTDDPPNGAETSGVGGGTVAAKRIGNIAAFPGPDRRGHRGSSGPPEGPGLVLSEMSDDELAAAAAVGDKEAFAVLVTRVSPGLLGYLRRMVTDPQTAEDLAQETLLHAWKSLPDFGFRSSFRTWMFSIAHRRTIDHRRRRHDVPTVDDRFIDLADPAPLPAERAEQSSLVEALRQELGSLPETSRAAWWLREAEGLSLDEISRVLQISTGSVRGHLQRSRRYLSIRLAPWRPGGPPGLSRGRPPDHTETSHDRPRNPGRGAQP